MIKLIEKLQQSPQTLHALVKENINNADIEHLISSADFLERVSVVLERVEEVPFFVKHVFKIVRLPLEAEVPVLQEYQRVGENESIRGLVSHLLESRVDDVEQLLNALLDSKEKGGSKEVKALLKQKVEPQYAHCHKLLEMLQQYGEDRQWKVNQYRQEIQKNSILTLQSLSTLPHIAPTYLKVLSKFMCETLLDPMDNFTFLTLLVSLSKQFPLFVRKIIGYWSSSQVHTNIPSHIFSSTIFLYFTCLFDNKLYFKKNPNEDLQELTDLCCHLYQLLKDDFPFEELGWIAIFSISKWVSVQIPEDSIYKCIAFLRETHDEEAIVSEILVSCLSRQFGQPLFKFSLAYEYCLLTLAPKELKYLNLILDQTLLIPTKEAIIQAAIQTKMENITIVALYLIHTTKLSQQFHHSARQFFRQQMGHFQDLCPEIQQSRYNSIQKEIAIFKKRYNFFVYSELGFFHKDLRLWQASILRFFRNSFINDYFAQEYWVNEEKIGTLVHSNENNKAKFDLICDFLQEEKVFNLSGVLLLSQVLKGRGKDPLQANEAQVIDIFTNFALKVLKNEVFVSNIRIIIDYLLTISHFELSSDTSSLILSSILNLPSKSEPHYNKVSFSIESLILNLLHQAGKLSSIDSYSSHLPFFRNKGRLPQGSEQYQQSILKIYNKYKVEISIGTYELPQLRATAQVRKLILTQTQPKHFQESLRRISDVFKFYSPLYKGQIVALTHISHSPQENYYFQNHYIPFLYQQYAKIYSAAAEKANNSLTQSIFDSAMLLLQQILQGDTFSHGQKFYKSLNRSQLAYILLSNSNLEHMLSQQLQEIINICLQIVQKDNYPLLRQYIEVIFCRAYLIINKRVPQGNLRRQIIAKMKVNINIGVPIALTLGYQLIQTFSSPNKQGKNLPQIHSIHELMVKFISCHTAYLRAICQYYLYLFLDLVDTKDQFLNNLKQFWKEDKDSQKILTNVAIVVEGFKQAVQGHCDFLGFQRVEEYPTNRVRMEFYRSIAKFYSEFILNEFYEKDFPSREVFEAMRQAADDRCQSLKDSYLAELHRFETNIGERALKSNMKKKVKEQDQKEAKKENVDKVKKQDKSKKAKAKERATAKPIPLPKQDKQDPISKLQQSFRLLTELVQFSHWCRKKIEPKIIVIATLLEKVHNFGHILRTLHGNNAMLVVPSDLPLLHPECKELVPKDCDVQIVEIRQRDLHKFITLMKSLGYPLAALEQCSRSVSVENSQFPERFMLLLGNERIGAPASLLNEGDLLVQIPQIGKIRSLNVHVSMVICLWEFLSKN